MTPLSVPQIFFSPSFRSLNSIERTCRTRLRCCSISPPIFGPNKPGEELDVGVVVGICGRDWGWYTTLNDNLEQLVARAVEFVLRDESVFVGQYARVIK